MMSLLSQDPSNSDKNGFICANCGFEVPFQAWGTRNRNHCPKCLFSLHVDNETGDRKSDCDGMMPPTGKRFRPDGEEMVVHTCQKCGLVRINRVAGDDSVEVLELLPVV